MESKHCVQASISSCSVLALILFLSYGNSYLCKKMQSCVVPRGWGYQVIKEQYVKKLGKAAGLRA